MRLTVSDTALASPLAQSQAAADRPPADRPDWVLTLPLACVALMAALAVAGYFLAG